MPLVALTNAAIESPAICAVSVGSVVAINVARNGIAGQTAQDDAADDRKPVAMTDGATDHTAGDCSQNRSCDAIVVMAVIRRSHCRGYRCEERGHNGGRHPH